MLSPSQVKNASDIVAELNRVGITNKYAQAGIISAIWKETLIKPVRENLNYTSASRLMEVFEGRFPNEASSIPYLNNPEKLGNYVYGGRFGNAANEGFKYRGAGYNGLTFKGAYQLYGDKIGVDLVNNPDKANEPETAAKIIASFYSDLYNKHSSEIQGKYNASPNNFKDLDTAVKAAISATAGFPSSWNRTVNEGYAKASTVAPSIYADQSIFSTNYLMKNKVKVVIAATIIVAMVGFGIYAVYYKQVKNA